MNEQHKGSCACGAVRFVVEGRLRGGIACHCSICRRQTGHHWASTDVDRSALVVEGMDNVTWWEASAKVERGFCQRCGSFLFWSAKGKTQVAVALGALDAPTGVTLEQHIFVRDKGDYYELKDGVLQNQQ